MEEKAKLRYLQFKKIGSTLALCSAIMFFSCSISRSSLYFSAVFKIIALFLYRISIIILNHHFVFLLGNAIIVTLFVKFACNNRNTADGNSSADNEYLIGDVLLEPVVLGDNEIIPAETENNLVPESLDCPISWREVTGKDDVFDRDKTDHNDETRQRRSETEPRRKTGNSEKVRLNVDDLSNEEFQREVEAFIERQRRFLREESLAVVSA